MADATNSTDVPGTKAFTFSSNKQLSSRFRGVCWNKKNKRWQAAINSHGKYLYLGSFLSEIEAARAFDRSAIKIRGLKAKLNFSYDIYFDADGNLRDEPLPSSGSPDHRSPGGHSGHRAGDTEDKMTGSSGSPGDSPSVDVPEYMRSASPVERLEMLATRMQSVESPLDALLSMPGSCHPGDAGPLSLLRANSHTARVADSSKHSGSLRRSSSHDMLFRDDFPRHRGSDIMPSGSSPPATPLIHPGLQDLLQPRLSKGVMPNILGQHSMHNLFSKHPSTRTLVGAEMHSPRPVHHITPTSNPIVTGMPHAHSMGPLHNNSSQMHWTGGNSNATVSASQNGWSHLAALDNLPNLAQQDRRSPSMQPASRNTLGYASSEAAANSLLDELTMDQQRHMEQQLWMGRMMKEEPQNDTRVMDYERQRVKSMADHDQFGRHSEPQGLTTASLTSHLHSASPTTLAMGLGSEAQGQQAWRRGAGSDPTPSEPYQPRMSLSPPTIPCWQNLISVPSQPQHTPRPVTGLNKIAWSPVMARNASTPPPRATQGVNPLSNGHANGHTNSLTNRHSKQRGMGGEPFNTGVQVTTGTGQKLQVVQTQQQMPQVSQSTDPARKRGPDMVDTQAANGAKRPLPSGQPGRCGGSEFELVQRLSDLRISDIQQHVLSAMKQLSATY